LLVSTTRTVIVSTKYNIKFLSAVELSFLCGTVQTHTHSFEGKRAVPIARLKTVLCQFGLLYSPPSSSQALG